jgi:hypothetical protein
VCTHPIDPMNILFLCCTHGNGHTKTHDVVCDLLLPLHKMLTFMWDENNYSISFSHVQLLLLINQHCVRQKWNSHPCWCCHCWLNTYKSISLILHNSNIYYLQCSSSQKKWTITTNIPSPFNNWSIWMSTQTSRCVLIWLCQYHLKPQKAKKPSSFCFDLF